MNRLFKKHKRLFIGKALKPLIVAFVLFATSALVYAVSYTPSSFFKSSTGTTITVAEYGVGKNVTNSSGKNYFIPTKMATEWSSFVSAVQSLSGISLSGLSWTTSGFGSCSDTCSGYTQTQTVWCAGGDGTIVSDSYCTEAKPPTTNICAAVPSVCPVNCVGSWSDTSTCSPTCDVGVKQQVYDITTPAANGGTACPYATGATQWGTTSCNTQPCVTYSWQYDGSFGACSSGSYSCGPGTKPLNYRCKGSDNIWYPDSSCSGTKPVSSASCLIGGVYCMGTQEFTSVGDSTFTVPNGINKVAVSVIGGGGGGGGGDGDWYGGGGGGGGAGGFISGQIVTGLSTGMVIPIKVGSGGAGGWGGGNNQGGLKGGDGTTSGFNGSPSVSGVVSLAAYAGMGGEGSPCGSLDCKGVGGAKGTVSSQAVASVSFQGDSGLVSTGVPYVDPDSGMSYINQPYTFGAGGNGGATSLIGGKGGGVGAPGGSWTNGGYCYSADNGSNGTVYGAGGGGGNSAFYGNGTTGVPGPNCAGGNGANGYVKVVW